MARIKPNTNPDNGFVLSYFPRIEPAAKFQGLPCWNPSLPAGAKQDETRRDFIIRLNTLMENKCSETANDAIVTYLEEEQLIQVD